MMGFHLKWVLVGVGALLFAVAGINYFHRVEPGGSKSPVAQEKEQAGRAGNAAKVQTMKPVRRDIASTLTVPGNVSPWFQTTLYAKVPGYLRAVNVDKGDVIRKGQLLAVIVAPEIEDQFRQAEADYRIKELTYERYLSVWRENHDIIAKQDVDLAEAAARAAKSLRDSRKTMMDYRKVTAPFDGVITARFADPGALIQAATGSASQAMPVFTIMKLDPVRVYVNVPQEVSIKAKEHIPAVVTVQELGGRAFKGSVTRSAKALDPTSRTLLLEIDLPNPKDLIHPGMFVGVTLSLETHQNALAVPPSAIVPGNSYEGKGPSLYTIVEGKAHRVGVTTGLDDGIWIEILDGLTGQEDVVVVGKGALQEGSPVEASPYSLPEGKPASQKL